MRRYKFLDKDSVFEALNRLRASFLAAKNAYDVEEIINGILTYDERMKIGRRIQIAELINKNIPYRQIAKTLKVGLTTVILVGEKINKNPEAYELILEQEEKVAKTYKQKSIITKGSSKMIFKKRVYIGISKKDIKR